MEGYVELGYTFSELVELLSETVEPERFSILEKAALEFDESGLINCDFLSTEERNQITSCLEEECLDDENDMICIHNVMTKSDEVLQFYVSDNGYEFYVLATAYDVRDDPEINFGGRVRQG